MCYRSKHREVHGAEFPEQALQFLPSHPALRGRYGKNLEEFRVFLIWEGNFTRLRVDHLPQTLFFAGLIALACHQLLDTDGVLGFSRQERKNPF